MAGWYDVLQQQTLQHHPDEGAGQKAPQGWWVEILLNLGHFYAVQRTKFFNILVCLNT